MSEEFDNDDIFLDGNIMEQLKITGGSIAPKTRANETKPIEIEGNDELEDELVQKSRELLNHSLSVVDTYSQYAAKAASAEDVEALSRIVQSTANALDQLQKFNTTRRKLAQQMVIENKRIESREKLTKDTNDTAYLMNRENALAFLESRMKEVDEKIASGVVIEIPEVID
tara:strand:- start:2627 stop:3139 length:513 start_codon:yes stop_codon:yes gene_type:complete